MIWLLILGSMGLLFAGGASLRWLAAQAPAPSAPRIPWADRPVPREAYVLERLFGLAVVGAALVCIVALMAGAENPLGPLVDAPTLAVAFGIGALIAAGPRGRDRFTTALFESNHRYAGRRGAFRLYAYTGDKDRRLRRLGAAPTVMVLLALGGLFMLAKPFITPARELHPARIAAPLGLPTMSDAMRAELEAAAAAGDPEALAVRAMFGAPSVSPSHFTFDGYTSERNVAWPLTGLVLLAIALRLLLTPASLSRREA